MRDSANGTYTLLLHELWVSIPVLISDSEPTASLTDRLTKPNTNNPDGQTDRRKDGGNDSATVNTLAINGSLSYHNAHIMQTETAASSITSLVIFMIAFDTFDQLP